MLQSLAQPFSTFWIDKNNETIQYILRDSEIYATLFTVIGWIAAFAQTIGHNMPGCIKVHMYWISNCLANETKYVQCKNSRLIRK